MKVVILGCGRVGARLATMMDRNGHNVSIIDSNPDSFRRLPETFGGETVLGTGIDVDVLKSAGIERADAFAAVTNGDNTNIMATQIAKEIFGVPKVLARIYDPGREGLYHDLGLETVCPTTLISTRVYDILAHDASPDGAGGMTQTSASRQTAQPVEPGSPQPQPVGSAVAPSSGAEAGSPRTPSAGAQPAPDGARPAAPDGHQDHPHKTQEGIRGLRGLFRP